MFILKERKGRERGRERETREKMVEGTYLIKNKFSYENTLVPIKKSLIIMKM